MFNNKYPFIVFGVIAAYFIGTNFIGYNSEREIELAEAETEKLERIKEI